MIDKFGRKPLLVIGSSIMTVMLATMAFVFSTAPVVDGAPVLEGAAGPIALIAANLFVVGFGMSWGPVVWVLLGDVPGTACARRRSHSPRAANGLRTWVITVSFPGLKDISFGLAYGLYATFALLSLLFVLRFVQETKGKQLEDMTGTVTTPGH